MNKTIDFYLNGILVSHSFEPTMRLIDVIRDHHHLTGTKEGCGEGECGACSVLINNELHLACLTPLGNVRDTHILTIEGFRNQEAYRIIEQAFIDAGAVQCGICTPGMVMAVFALLKENPKPNDLEIKIALSGNLCRCTGYNMIFEAVSLASKKGEHLWLNT